MIIIQIMLISWFITRFKPLQMLLEYFITKTENNPMVSLILSFLFLPLTCFSCANFWIGLFLTHNFYYAVTASFIGTWYELLLGYKENIIKLSE